VLRRKLQRDLLRQRWQILAVVVVTVLGTCLFTTSYLAYQDLRDSYHAIQVDTHLADITLNMTAVTASQTARVSRLPGVAVAEQQVVVDLPVAFAPHGGTSTAQASSRLVTGRLISIPLGRQPSLNQLVLTAGSLPDRHDEVVLEQHIATHFGLRPGASFQIVLPSGPVTVRVAGIGVSAEYLWVARNRQDVLPSAAEFGVIFVPRPLLTRLGHAARAGAATSQTSSWLAPLRQAAMPDTGNRLLYDLRPGANSAAVLAQVRAIVGSGAILDATPRSELVGVQLLQLDVDGFQEIAVLFPLLFLTVGGFITAALLHRQVDQEQAIIGTMMALGLRERMVIRHYVAEGAVIGLCGALLGSVAGILLGNAIARYYAGDLHIPSVVTQVDWLVVLTGAVLGIAVPTLAGLAPARRAARLDPAVAMRPAPLGAGFPHLRGMTWFRHLPLWLQLPRRNIGRHPIRALATALGVSAALVLVVSTAGMLDSMTRGVDLTFNQAQRYDLRADFFAARPAEAVQRQVSAMPGVRILEKLISLPAQLQHAGHTYDTVLQGLPAPSPLLAVLDASGHRLQPAPDEAVLSQSVAVSLHVGVGDTVQARLLPDGPTLTLRISALSDELLGNAMTISAQAAARDVGLADGITTVLVTTDPRQRGQVQARLEHLAGVARVTNRQVTKAQVTDLLGLFDAFIGMMLLFATALAAAILFNTASITVLERRREFATMRALGQRMGRLSWMVTVENGLLALGGLVIGFPVALLCLWAFLQVYSTDLFNMPFWLYPRTVGLALVGVLLVVLVSQVPALRAVAGMNIAEAAKARE
jgi:putative ABC transport system permease protein